MDEIQVPIIKGKETDSSPKTSEVEDLNRNTKTQIGYETPRNND